MKTVTLDTPRSFTPVMTLDSRTPFAVRETCICPQGAGRCSRCPLRTTNVKSLEPRFLVARKQ